MRDFFDFWVPRRDWRHFSLRRFLRSLRGPCGICMYCVSEGHPCVRVVRRWR